VATEFTKDWMSNPQNQRIIYKANRMAQELIEIGKPLCHPFIFFQEMAMLDLVLSDKELVKQGWSKSTLKKYLADDVIFSFKGINVYLAGAAIEAARAMPDGAMKSKIALRKLFQ
jgi:hypothetical protein